MTHSTTAQAVKKYRAPAKIVQGLGPCEVSRRVGGKEAKGEKRKRGREKKKRKTKRCKESVFLLLSFLSFSFCSKITLEGE